MLELAILRPQLTDETGSDDLVAGEPFYVKVVAEQRDHQVRLTAQNIAPG